MQCPTVQPRARHSSPRFSIKSNSGVQIYGGTRRSFSDRTEALKILGAAA